MNADRKAIFQLLAAGRIDPAQAERLIAVFAAHHEDLWAIAACAAIVGLAQIQFFAPGIVHLLRAGLSGAVPALHHALKSFALCFGGLS
jgi:hypothetical protein